MTWALWGIGGFFVALSALAFVSGSIAAGSVGLVGAAIFMRMARRLSLQIVAVQRNNTAVQHLMRGDFAAAEAMLAGIPPAAMDGTVRRAVSTVRALIALYEGRPEESAKLATVAIEGRRSILGRSIENDQIAAALAVRALAFVATGDVDRAKADADAAETSVHATPEVIARARVVRALLASRAVYHEEAFRKYVTATAPLVLEYAAPRERVLFRALRRMAGSRQQQSAYRMPGRVKGDREPSKLASWISLVAPDAASFVDEDRAVADHVEEMVIPSGVPSDVRALRDARAGVRGARPARRGLRLLVLWGLLVVMFLAIWQFLTPAIRDDTRAPPPPPVVEAAPDTLVSVLTWVVSLGLPVVLFGVCVVVIMALASKRARDLAVARRLVAIGEQARALPMLERLTSSPNAIVAATAGLELARLAARRADFGEAVIRCDVAIARVSPQPHRAVAADILLPALMTESAVANAARGSADEADAELAILCRDFPTYPHLPSSLLRVRLVRAARGGDRDAAFAAARSRTGELPLPYREEILADLVLASRRELGEADRARVDSELRDDEQLQRWVEIVAPGLVDHRTPNQRAADPVPPPAPALAAGEGNPGEGNPGELEAAEISDFDAAQKRVEASG